MLHTKYDKAEANIKITIKVRIPTSYPKKVSTKRITARTNPIITDISVFLKVGFNLIKD